MTADKLVSAAGHEPMERLRWLVLKYFSVLPCSREAKKMTDRECLRIAALMAGERFAQEKPGEEYISSSFDEKKLIELGGGGHGRL